MSKTEKTTEVHTIPDIHAISWDEWCRQNVIPNNEFTKSEDPDLKARYPLRNIREEDLSFTFQVEDDRVNVTAIFSDYDWMTYKYDARFPTKTMGTLAVRFEYYGAPDCSMYVRQFLPSYLTGLDKHVYIDHHYEFSARRFDEFMKQDLEARIRSISDTYAYCPETIIMDFFNRVLNEGTPTDITMNRLLNDLAWTSVRIPKPENNK